PFRVEAVLTRPDAKHAWHRCVAHDGSGDRPDPVAEVDGSSLVLVNQIARHRAASLLDELQDFVALDVVNGQQKVGRVLGLVVIDPAHGAKQLPLAQRSWRALERQAFARKLLGWGD